MRHAFHDGVKKHGSTHNWDHVITQIGMFCFTGVTSEQVDILRNDYKIYLTQDGRISIAGLNTGNIDTVTKAFHEVTQGKQF